MEFARDHRTAAEWHESVKPSGRCESREERHERRPRYVTVGRVWNLAFGASQAAKLGRGCSFASQRFTTEICASVGLFYGVDTVSRWRRIILHLGEIPVIRSCGNCWTFMGRVSIHWLVDTSYCSFDKWTAFYLKTFKTKTNLILRKLNVLKCQVA